MIRWLAFYKMSAAGEQKAIGLSGKASHLTRSRIERFDPEGRKPQRGAAVRGLVGCARKEAGNGLQAMIVPAGNGKGGSQRPNGSVGSLVWQAKA